MTKQTTFRTADAKPSGNISMPFGIIELVRAGFRRLGLYGFLDSLKTKGVPLSYVIELMCIHQLSGGASMNKCGADASSPLMISELCHGYRISRKTMERALEILDTYLEDVLDFIWRKLKTIYAIERTDVYVDGSHIERYGHKGRYTAVGEGGGTLQWQDQFMIAQLMEPSLPIKIEAYPGNLNDPPQYDDFIPQLMFMLEKGSMIVMDAGGSSKKTLDDITDNSMDYLARVRMNESDDAIIRDEKDSMMYIGRGVACIRHEFASSEKTNYLFFSVDRYILGMLAAERRTVKLANELKDAKEVMAGPKLNKLIKIKKNPFFRVNINSFDVSMTLDPWAEDDILKAAETDADDRCGWFKLQSSRRLASREALDMYRHRVGIEHLISSIKSVVKLKPLRVWTEGSVRGSLLLAMISQLMISMVRQDLEPELIEKKEDGKMIIAEHRPSNKAICESLVHWTVTVIPKDGFGTERIFSNESELSGRIHEILKQY